VQKLLKHIESHGFTWHLHAKEKNMLYTLIENTSIHSASVEYTPMIQRSIYKANDPDKKDFLSQNPNLIWGILMGLMVLAFALYAYLKNKKDR